MSHQPELVGADVLAHQSKQDQTYKACRHRHPQPACAVASLLSDKLFKAGIVFSLFCTHAFLIWLSVMWLLKQS